MAGEEYQSAYTGKEIDERLGKVPGLETQVGQLSAEKVGKTSLTLGLHTDGKYYIFVDGAPVGSGFELSGNSGDLFGYVNDETKTIVLENAPDGEYTLAYVNDDGILVPIGSMVKDTNVYYTVTNTLTSCTNSNSDTQVIGGQSYSAVISANSGYDLSSVVVTMGGVDVSASAVSGGNISIAEVTGDIVITAVGEEAVQRTNFCVPNTTVGTTYYADTNPDSPSYGWISGGRCSSTGADRTDSPNAVLTNYIQVQNGDEVYVENFEPTTTSYSGLYKSDKSAIGGFKFPASGDKASYVKSVVISSGTVQFVIDNANAGYIRICGYPTNVVDSSATTFFTKYDINNLNIKVYVKRNGNWL